MQDDEKILLVLIIVGGVIFGFIAIVAAYFFLLFGAVVPTRPVYNDTSTGSSGSGIVEPTTSSVTKVCEVGGCSGELCMDPNSDSPSSSICIYKDEFACYKKDFAKCEVQKDGACGWTDSDELKSCLGGN